MSGEKEAVERLYQLRSDADDELVRRGARREPREQPYDPRRDRETVRRWVAIGLVGLLAIEVVGAFILFAATSRTIGEPKDLMTVVITPTVSLVGAAVGFHYGSVRAGD